MFIPFLTFADDIRQWKKENCFLCSVDHSGHLLVPMFKGPQQYFRMKVIRADKEVISLKMVGLADKNGVQRQADMNFGSDFEREAFMKHLGSYCTAYFDKGFKYYASGFHLTQGQIYNLPENHSRGTVELTCKKTDPRSEMGWGEWMMSYLPGRKPNRNNDERSSGKILIMPVAPKEIRRSSASQQ